MKKIRLYALLTLSSFTVGQKVFSQACTFVSPLVQVVNTKDSVDGSGNHYCVQTIDLSVDINVNNGNTWTYIHLWTTANYHNLPNPPGGQGTLGNKAPTNADILASDLLTIALTYNNNQVNGGQPTLMSTYGPDALEDPQVQGPSKGVSFTTSAVTSGPNAGATHFVFHNIRIVSPGACDPSTTFKGDAWSSQSQNGGNVQCSLPGFVFATADPSVTANLNCNTVASGLPNILNFTVNANGSGNQISFQFDVYSNTDKTSAFDPNLDTKIFTGTQTYTITQGVGTSSQSFKSDTLAFYPAPYSTDPAYRYNDVYIVVRNIVITNGGTPTNISNALVTSATNTCLSLSAKFGSIIAEKHNGQLLINWQTLTEENSKEFVIEASNDGKTWTAIGKASSRAANGNSGAPIDYSVTIAFPVALGLVGFGGLLLLTMGGRRWMRIGGVSVILVMILVSCLKDSKTVDIENGASVFVRIAEHDADGAVQYSKVVKVVNK